MWGRSKKLDKVDREFRWNLLASGRKPMYIVVKIDDV
jgi:hypothetical protein